MPPRTTFSDLSTPPLAGTAFLAEYAQRLKSLFDASALPLTSVAGTGNAVTASLDPPLDAGGLVNGMKFTITWAASNTGAVTLAINGGSAVPVVDADNVALSASTLVAGRRSLLEFVSGSFRILSSAGGGGSGAGPDRQTFTASGTWTKPTGYDPDTIVMVELWGGGGGGGRSGAGNALTGTSGGGGGYVQQFFRIADLPASVSVTVGAGGSPAAAANAAGTAGGNSSFGSLLTAYGGAAGGAYNTSGGVGGGILATGSMGNGAGGGGNATHPWGGGGGTNSLGTGNTANPGGSSYLGGGGGAAGNNAGGTSVFGGNGGAGPGATLVANSGTAPGGGGGGGPANNSTAAAGAGARGECRVTIFG